MSDDKQKKAKGESCFNCGARPSHPRSKCPAKKTKCFKCGKEGHYASLCKSKVKDPRINEVHNQSTTASTFVDRLPDEYEPVYFDASVHHLMTVTVESLNRSRYRESHTFARCESAGNLCHKSTKCPARLTPEQAVISYLITKLRHFL